MYVRAGRPVVALPYVGVNRSTSLMSSSLLLQQCPACLVCLTWIVFVIGGRIVGALWGVATSPCLAKRELCVYFEKSNDIPTPHLPKTQENFGGVVH